MKKGLKEIDAKVLAELVIRSVKKLPNDADLGKRIRQICNLMEPVINPKN